MKAIVVSRFGDPQVLEIRTVADPVPQAGQVLIRVRPASVNFGRTTRQQCSVPFALRPVHRPHLARDAQSSP